MCPNDPATTASSTDHRLVVLALRVAARLHREGRAVPAEQGNDLLGMVAANGDLLATALERLEPGAATCGCQPQD